MNGAYGGLRSEGVNTDLTMYHDEGSRNKPGALVYLAGYFDGEGCITVLKQGGTGLCLRVTIVSADEQVLRLFETVFCQRVYEVKHVSSKSRTKCKLFRWSVSGSRAVPILRDLEPFLITKRNQAKVALRADWDTRITRKTQDLVAQRAAVKAELSSMKKAERGTSADSPSIY